MASSARIIQTSGRQFATSLPKPAAVCRSCRHLSTAASRQPYKPSLALPASPLRRAPAPLATTGAGRGAAALHTSAQRQRRRAGDDEGTERPRTDFGALDVLGNTPVPSYSVDVCMSDGFQFNNGAKVADGSGAIIVGGEAFAWRPWGPEKRLLNDKGQWHVSDETLGLFDLIWPRPDLLILGLGRDIRPISPELRRHIGRLGMRVDVLDTRNAASQFNLLATERGINNIAAALIPIGWKEGVGAEW